MVSWPEEEGTVTTGPQPALAAHTPPWADGPCLDLQHWPRLLSPGGMTQQLPLGLSHVPTLGGPCRALQGQRGWPKPPARALGQCGEQWVQAGAWEGAGTLPEQILSVSLGEFLTFLRSCLFL